MSGGYFDYTQQHLIYIANEIEKIIQTNPEQFDKPTLMEFKEALGLLRLGYIYCNRIDLLLSGEDNPESFRLKLFKEINDLAKKE